MKLTLAIFLLITSTVGCSKVKFAALKPDEAASVASVPDVPVDDSSASSNEAFEISSSGKLSQSQQVIIQSSLGSFSPTQASHDDKVVSVRTGFSETLGELF